MKDNEAKLNQKSSCTYNAQQETFKIGNQALINKRVYFKKKTCPSCGNEFSKGRTDKKYCSSQCRSRIHNAYNRDKLSHIHEVNRCLRKNRNLLKSLQGKGKTPKLEMNRLGFATHLFTSIKFVDDKKVTLCYDYGYYTDKEGNFIIFYFPQLE